MVHRRELRLLHHWRRREGIEGKEIMLWLMLISMLRDSVKQ
jgi:hypothetical protein